jgi:sugar phosphate isomerase/epimerase
VEFAAEFASKYVVLHLGTVPIKKISRELTKMVEDGLEHTPEYVKRKLKLIKSRESLSKFYCGRARAALKIIAETAEKVKVPVAVESRSSYEQVPSEREMLGILQDFAPPWVGYWHDFGHVQLKANLGLLDHYEWLSSAAPRLIGCHLHDVQWPARDHRVPFQGSVDYDRLLPLIPHRAPLVWELSPSRKAEDIKLAREVWLAKYPQWS